MKAMTEPASEPVSEPMPAAKTLARWCYDRGLDERLVEAGDQQLLARALVEALGRRAAPEVERAAWEQTAALLRQRRAWDHAHQVAPPPAAPCAWCVVDRSACPHHAPCRCRTCGGPMRRSILLEGFDTHPCCDLATEGTTGTATTDVHAEVVSQILGATLLAEPA